MKPIFAILLLLCAALTLPAAESKPNILVILGDDLGYADLSVQGSPDVRTPRIDSIAANGIRRTAGNRAGKAKKKDAKAAAEEK